MSFLSWLVQRFDGERQGWVWHGSWWRYLVALYQSLCSRLGKHPRCLPLWALPPCSNSVANDGIRRLGFFLWWHGVRRNQWSLVHEVHISTSHLSMIFLFSLTVFGPRSKVILRKVHKVNVSIWHVAMRTCCLLLWRVLFLRRIMDQFLVRY